MESMRRFLNPLVLNLQKMEPLKLLSAPTMLPCYHTSCSTCATTRTANGYSCAICKAAYRPQDLRPASHLGAIVSIHRNLSSTVSTMLIQQDIQVDIPVAKTTSQGTPESGNRSGVDKSDQMKSYNHVASKLVYNQSTGPAFGNTDDVQPRDVAFANKAADAAVVPTVLVQKGHSGSQSSDGPGDLDCDSNDLQGYLITSRSAPQNAFKREPNAMDEHARELKRQKSIDQGHPTLPGPWKCEFCHSSIITEGKMSLISQNALQKRRIEKGGTDDGNDEGMGSPIAMDAEAGKESKLKNHNKETKKKRAKVLEAQQKKEDEEMRQLESSLFGALYAPPAFGTEVGASVVAPGQDAPLFFTDRSAGDGAEDIPICEEDLAHEDEEDEVGDKGRKPVWVDEEEERTEVDILRVARLRKLRKEADDHLISGKEYEARLRGQHAKLNPFTGWADMDRKAPLHATSDSESDEGGVDDILQNNDELVVKGTAKLLPGMLEFSRLVDANIQEPSNGPINSVQFHRNGQLMLAAGLDKHLRFFQIDGKRNPKIQSIFIEDCPVLKASFLPDGSEVILSGRRKFFYSFDLVNAAVSKIGPLTGREEKSLESFEISPDSKTIAFVGNEGYILLISSRTKQLIGTLKMNGSVRSLAFADGGNQLLSSGGDGHVYHWDLRTRKCIHKAMDDGSLGSSSLCTSQDSSLFATGSTSGIVNVYKRDDFLGGKRKPLKTIENLTTDVGEMKFNHDAQILAISSRNERNGMRLVHVPSFSVFQNWPGPRFSLHYPRCLDFSPGSGFLSVGHAGGKVLLYKLHHYENA